MSKAEEIHYKAVIAADNQKPPKEYCISAHADHFNGFVEGFIEGYRQAEKDLIDKTLDFLKDKLYENGYVGIIDLCDDYIKAMKDE